MLIYDAVEMETVSKCNIRHWREKKTPEYDKLAWFTNKATSKGLLDLGR